MFYNWGVRAEPIENRKSSPFLLGAGCFYMLMLVLSSFKSLEGTFIWAFDDKFLHFLFYFLLTGLVFFGLSGVHWFRRLTMALIVGSLLGAFDEVLQCFTNRDSNLDDWLVDLAGVYIALFLLVGAHFAAIIVRAFYSGLK